jgi:hypothetical protein
LDLLDKEELALELLKLSLHTHTHTPCILIQIRIRGFLPRKPPNTTQGLAVGGLVEIFA